MMYVKHKFSLLILFASLAFLSFSFTHERYTQTEYGPAIEWNPAVKLEWSDFRAKKKNNFNSAVAVSSCGFGLESETYDGITKHRISVRFYCDESWRAPELKDPAVLAHEQLHFDICEIFGRKLCKELLQHEKTGNLSHKKTQALYNDVMDAYNKYQDLYDSQTGHSRNKDKQEEWSLRVKKELEELQPYAGYRYF